VPECDVFNSGEGGSTSPTRKKGTAQREGGRDLRRPKGKNRKEPDLQKGQWGPNGEDMQNRGKKTERRKKLWGKAEKGVFNVKKY